MKTIKIFLCSLIVLCQINYSFSQTDSIIKSKAYRLAVKTNMVELVTGKAGLAFEKPISKKKSIELAAGYDYWKMIVMGKSLLRGTDGHNVSGFFTQLGYRFYFDSNTSNRSYGQLNFIYDSYKINTLEKKWDDEVAGTEAICAPCLVAQNYKAKVYGLYYTQGFTKVSKKNLISELSVSLGVKFKQSDLNILYVETYKPYFFYYFNNDYKLTFYKVSPVVKFAYTFGFVSK